MPEGLVQISGGESVSDLMGWKMKHKLRKLLFGVMLPVVASLHAHSQDVTFVPEVDANFELTSTYRVYVEAKNERDGGDPNQLGIGPSFQMYLKPIVKLKAINSFDLNDSKSRAFVLVPLDRCTGCAIRESSGDDCDAPLSFEKGVSSIRSKPGGSRLEERKL
jgi:hypothetical protein